MSKALLQCSNPSLAQPESVQTTKKKGCVLSRYSRGDLDMKSSSLQAAESAAQPGAVIHLDVFFFFK